MRRWVSRNKNDFSCEDEIIVWDGQPEKEEFSDDCDWTFNRKKGGARAMLLVLDKYEFKDTFGFLPKRGTCKLYELNCIEVKE